MISHFLILFQKLSLGSWLWSLQFPSLEQVQISSSQTCIHLLLQCPVSAWDHIISCRVFLLVVSHNKAGELPHRLNFSSKRAGAEETQNISTSKCRHIYWLYEAH